MTEIVLDKVRKAAGNLLDQITGFDPLGPLQAISAGPSGGGG